MIYSCHALTIESFSFSMLVKSGCDQGGSSRWFIFLCWPGMVPNQRQLFIVVSDWGSYLGSLLCFVGSCFCVAACEQPRMSRLSFSSVLFGEFIKHVGFYARCAFVQSLRRTWQSKVLETIEHYEKPGKPGLVFIVDFEKAFDKVRLEIIYKCLEYFNFGESLIKWVKVMYRYPSCEIGNNGYFSKY